MTTPDREPEEGEVYRRVGPKMLCQVEQHDIGVVLSVPEGPHAVMLVPRLGAPVPVAKWTLCNAVLWERVS